MDSTILELAQSVEAKRAAALEAWQLLHAEHVPGPNIDYDLDSGMLIVSCSCGAGLEMVAIVQLCVRHLTGRYAI